MTKFSKEELKKRSCRRIAEVLHGHFLEGTGIHSRIFEVLIPDEYVIAGESKKGKAYREHVVPLCVVRFECIQMYKNGAGVEAVAQAIERHIAIIKIANEESILLDQEKGWKTTMPSGWKFNEGSIYARLKEAGIEFELYEESKEDAA